MNAPHTLALDYDVYEIAYLAGGPCRAVDAAVVALVQSGRAAVDPTTGHLSAPDGRGHHHWLESAVLDAIRTRGIRTLETLRWRVRTDERFADVRRRLQDDGLLRRSAPSSPSARAWPVRALTGAGRRTLRHLRDTPPVDGSGALSVALRGPGAMTDPALRSALFDPPPPPSLPSRRTFRRNPNLPGYEASTVSAAALGFWVTGSGTAGWGVNGGAGSLDGMGGGDGGGGGGGDG